MIEYNPLFLLPLLFFIVFLLLDNKCNCRYNNTKIPLDTGLAFTRGVLAYEKWKKEIQDKGLLK